VIAYTGDTGPIPALAGLARGADLFIAEASDRTQRPGTPLPPPGLQLHLSSRDAGEAARVAGAQRLMLTHFWPGNDRAATRARAAEHFKGEIILAEEGLEVPLADA
jgi:ribonuclease BN (tRNA processing enzyme)